MAEEQTGAAKQEGASEMLGRIRGALATWPDGGCDIEVAQHVQRIVNAQTSRLRRDIKELEDSRQEARNEVAQYAAEKGRLREERDGMAYSYRATLETLRRVERERDDARALLPESLRENDEKWDRLFIWMRERAEAAEARLREAAIDCQNMMDDRDNAIVAQRQAEERAATPITWDSQRQSTGSVHGPRSRPPRRLPRRPKGRRIRAEVNGERFMTGRWSRSTRPPSMSLRMVTRSRLVRGEVKSVRYAVEIDAAELWVDGRLVAWMEPPLEIRGLKSLGPVTLEGRFLSERLTDEELAKLEDDLKGRGEAAWSLAWSRIDALVSEVRAARELLAELEWRGEPVGDHGDTPTCPSCRAPASAIVERWSDSSGNERHLAGSASVVGTHAPGCKLAALLGRGEPK